MNITMNIVDEMKRLHLYVWSCNWHWRDRMIEDGIVIVKLSGKGRKTLLSSKFKYISFCEHYSYQVAFGAMNIVSDDTLFPTTSPTL